MEKVTEKTWSKPVHAFIPWYEVDYQTQAQIRSVAELPFLADFIAIMPDTHLGYGVPIGCILKTSDHVIPNAVGVDIGCGVGFRIVPNIDSDLLKNKDFWLKYEAEVLKQVPVGFNWHNHAQGIQCDLGLRMPLDNEDEHRARCQLGTLGGGNHFMEVQVNANGAVVLMVHSGSRRLGGIVAKHYHDHAMTESTGIPKDLAALKLASELGQNYIHDMNLVTKYAAQNRELMLAKMTDILYRLLREEDHPDTFDPKMKTTDRPHNYATAEYGITTHWKGAMHLPIGTIGAIPGSMGSNTYIVKGVGNLDAHDSTSHGAGRAMSRGQAKKNVSMEDFETSLAGTFSVPKESYLDESPAAYKSIDTVMERQSSLLEVISINRPLLTIKGSSSSRED